VPAPSHLDGSTPSTPASTKPNGLTPAEKAERERLKKKEKKERKDRERAEKAAAGPESGPAAESTSAAADAPAPADSESKPAGAAEELKSPLTDGGARTPKTGRPPRNPWTIFMKMAAGTTVNDADIREFFGEAKGGITKITLPPPFPGRPQRLGYIEFGDEEAMRAGLEKHLPVRFCSFHPADLKLTFTRCRKSKTPCRR
jgi:hypothetical protein